MLFALNDTTTLGVTGMKTYKKSSSKYPGLLPYFDYGSAFSNLYKFQKVTTVVTVDNNVSTQKVTYTTSDISSDFHVISRPDNANSAKTAWRLIANNLKKSDQSPLDIHYFFKKGARVTIGDESLVFTQDYDFLHGEVTSELNVVEMQQSVKIEPAEKADLTKTVVHQPAGPPLGFNASAYVLQHDADITIAILNLSTDHQNSQKGVFSTVKGKLSSGSTDAASYLLAAINNTIGMYSGQNATVDIHDVDVVATIGNKKYATLNEAIQAANGGFQDEIHIVKPGTYEFVDMPALSGHEGMATLLADVLGVIRLHRP